MDFYEQGYNAGYGYIWKNHGTDYPQSDFDRYSFERGFEEGQRRRKISDELDREMGWDD